MRLEEIEKIKSELVDANSVTNAMILEGYLVGVIEDNTTDRVRIIKNRVNNVLGIVPVSIWLSLVNNLDDYKIKAINKRGAKLKGLGDEIEENSFNEIFDDFTSVFSDSLDRVRPKAEQAKDEIEAVVKGSAETLENTLYDFIKSIEKGIEDKIDDLQPKVQEVKTKAARAVVKGITAAQKIKFEIQKVKLIKIKRESISEGVATKGFIKKIDVKINKISLALVK